MRSRLPEPDADLDTLVRAIEGLEWELKHWKENQLAARALRDPDLDRALSERISELILDLDDLTQAVLKRRSSYSERSR